MLGKVTQYRRELAIAAGVCVAGFALWRLFAAEEPAREDARPVERAKSVEDAPVRNSFDEPTFIPTKEFIAATQPLVRESGAARAELTREELLRVFAAARQLMAFDRERLDEQKRLILMKLLTDYAAYEKEFGAFELALQKLRGDALAYVCHYTNISLDALTRKKIELVTADPALAAELEKTPAAVKHVVVPTVRKEDLLKLYAFKCDFLKDFARKRQKERAFLNRQAFEQFVSDVVTAHSGVTEDALDLRSPLFVDREVLALRNKAEALRLELQIKNV